MRFLELTPNTVPRCKRPSQGVQALLIMAAAWKADTQQKRGMAGTRPRQAAKRGAKTATASGVPRIAVHLSRSSARPAIKHDVTNAPSIALLLAPPFSDWFSFAAGRPLTGESEPRNRLRCGWPRQRVHTAADLSVYFLTMFQILCVMAFLLFCFLAALLLIAAVRAGHGDKHE